MFCNIWLEWEERDSVDEGSGGAKKEDIRQERCKQKAMLTGMIRGSKDRPTDQYMFPQLILCPVALGLLKNKRNISLA